MKVTMLLADFAQVNDNKLTAVGAGWNMTPGGPYSVPSGIGLIFWVPWDRTNHRHSFTLSLNTEDGEPALVGDPGEPIVIADTFEVGRPPGVKPGTEFPLALALNIGPLGLPFDTGFVWRLEVAQVDAVAECAFRTGPPPAEHG